MSINNSLRNASVIFALLLTVSAPIATRADEPAAEPAAASDTKLVCRWGRQPGSQTKEKFCATDAQWRAFFQARARQVTDRASGNSGSGNSGAVGYPPSPSIPGMNGFGTGASQASFQR
jgi:hypothetical protein